MSVQAVRILNTKNVNIHSDAISGLPSLTSLSLRDMDTAVIEQGGMNMQKQAKPRQVLIENIETLNIKSQAFSGFWGQHNSVEMRKIARLHIESHAFHYESRSLGPSLMLQDIGMLTLASKSFKSPVARMYLNKVVMETCHDESFGGDIQATEFDNVTIGEAKAGCVTGFGSSTALSVKSSRIDVIHSRAISGQLSQLIIKNSDFLTMHEKSMDLKVKNMTMSDLFVQQLHSNGLIVKADDSIRLKKIRVNSLGKNALVGLQIEPTSTGFYPPVVIDQLEVIDAEQGSLTFSECTDVQMTDLDLEAPWPHICPTERWTRALSEGAVSGPLSPAQHEVFWQLYEKGLCDDEDDKQLFPKVANRPKCDRHQNSGDAYKYDAEDAVLGKESAAFSRGDKDKQQSRRIVAGIAAAESEAMSESSVVKKADSSLVSLEVKVPEDGEDHKDAGGDEATVEYLVDYEEAEKDVQTHDARKADNVTSRAIEDALEALPLVSTPSIATRSAPNVRNKKAPPTGPDDAAGEGPVGTVGGSAPSAAPPAAASDGDSDHSHRLLLYLALGAVLSLAAVLAVALLVMLVRRRRRRGKADGTPVPMEALLMVMANRLLQQNGAGGDREAGGGERQRQMSESSGFSSGRQSVDSHRYEPIREDLLVQLPASPAQLIWLDDSPAPSDQLYHSLLDR